MTTPPPPGAASEPAGDAAPPATATPAAALPVTAPNAAESVAPAAPAEAVPPAPAARRRVPRDRFDESVTDHLRTDYVRVRDDRTVGEALADVRRSGAPGRIVYFYVLDADGRLVGVVPTRRLLLSPPETPVRDVMVPRPITLPESATVLEACELFIQHRLLALPVVAGGGRMAGVVDVELYTEEIGDLHAHREAADVFQLVGVRLAQVRGTGVGGAFRERFPWLLANVSGGLACAAVSGLFAGLLEAVVALAFFVTVVLALAESVSIQSLTLALQEGHGRRFAWRDAVKELLREPPLGSLLGAGCGLLVAAAAWPWQGPRIALCLVLSIVVTVTLAAFFGRLVPTLLRAFRVDPRVAAGPITLALTDLATLTCYFGLGTLLFR